MNRKVKFFKQTMFLLEQCAVSKLTTSVRSAIFWPWHRPTIICESFYSPTKPRNSLFGCVKWLLVLKPRRRF